MTAPADPKTLNPSPTVTLFVVASVQFLTPFMMTAMGVALPAIGREFRAGAVHLGMIEMVYILAVTLLLLPAGRYADIHGRKRVFIAGASLMTVATLLLAMSTGIRFFIVLRFFQGVGAAMITSTKEMTAAPWFAAAGGAGLILFLFYESKIDSPLLDVRLLATNRVFTFSNIATWINDASCFGLIFFFSLYLQSIRGLTAQATGLTLVIQPVVQALFSPISGRLADRYPPANIATMGMAICTIALTFAVFLGADTPMPMIYMILALIGLGFGLFSSPNTTAVMSSVGPEHYGIAASLLATMRGAGMLTSMTIITAILTIFMGNHPLSPDTHDAFIISMHTAFICFSVMCAVGIGCSFVRFNPKK